MSLFDFYTDWANSIALIGSMMCYQRIFGAMMMLTIILLPMIFAFFQPNYDEMRFHERWLRKCKFSGIFNHQIYFIFQHFSYIKGKSTHMFPTSRAGAIRHSIMQFFGASSFSHRPLMLSVRPGYFYFKVYRTKLFITSKR